MHPQLHATFDGLAILTLAGGLYLRLRRHPRYTNELLINGVIYIVWAGIALAWLPNLVLALRSWLVEGQVVSGWWRAGLDNWMLGLAGGVGAGVLFIRRHHLPLWFILDKAAPVLALTLVVWRIGCAINGDAYGKPTSSWAGLWLPDVHGDYAWRYPTQAISIGMNLLIALALLGFERLTAIWWRKPAGWPFPGFLFWTYIALYCVQRFVFEFWRGDKATIYDDYTITHVYCLIGLGLAAWGYWHGWRQGKGHSDAVLRSYAGL